MKTRVVLGCLIVWMTNVLAQDSRLMDAAMIEKLETTLVAKLADPRASQYRNVFIATDATEPRARVLCGEVNVKNQAGGYAGFVRFYVVDDSKTGDAYFQMEGLPLFAVVSGKRFDPLGDASVAKFAASYAAACASKLREVQ